MVDLIDQDKLKSHVDGLITQFKPCNRIILACIPASLFDSYKQIEGFVAGNKPEDTETNPGYFIHAPWFKMVFHSSVPDFSLRGAEDAPQPKAFRRTSLKAVRK